MQIREDINIILKQILHTTATFVTDLNTRRMQC